MSWLIRAYKPQSAHANEAPFAQLGSLTPNLNIALLKNAASGSSPTAVASHPVTARITNGALLTNTN